MRGNFLTEPLRLTRQERIALSVGIFSGAALLTGMALWAVSKGFVTVLRLMAL